MSADASGPIEFAAMAGLSIAAKDAAAWVTDFLNAAYYRRPEDEREVDDVRLAFCVLTTAWYQKGPGARLRITDLPGFVRAFGRGRLEGSESGRGVLSRRQLLEGAAKLLGDWFPDAYEDDARRAWGIAFETGADREAYDFDRRMGFARLGDATPPTAPIVEQTWRTYDPVAVPDVQAALDALARPERWPDHASEIGRFTPLRPGGLPDQTFEIDVATGTDSGTPVFTRGYVTVTRVVTPDDADARAKWFAELEHGLAEHGRPRAVPHNATPFAGIEMTTHEGHFLGRGQNRLVLYEDVHGHAFVRAAGSWDPMPAHVRAAYETAGADAQDAFWGDDADEDKSTLHQLARRLGSSDSPSLKE